MKEKLWIGLIILGMIITVGSIVADLVLVFNGVFIPTNLGWAISMVGVCIISLGIVFGVGGMSSRC